MYAVIKTGGKRYRVQAGDLLVVEKLDGEPGVEVAFGEVLMLGEGEAVTVGAPLVDGAVVSATLIETRKGEKVKVFKKIRRQGYRRTRGHHQTETVLRVTSVAGASKEAKWDGVVDLTPKVIQSARARGLAGATAAAKASSAPVKAEAETAAPQRVADVLGGIRLLRQRIDTSLDAHDLIVAGMPASALNHLVDKLITVRDKPGFESALGMSLRTRQRRRDTPAKPLNAEQGGRVWKFAEVLVRAIDILGSQSEAEQWLVRPAIGLDQRAPIELLASSAGAEVVEDYLTRIEYGAYT